VGSLDTLRDERNTNTSTVFGGDSVKVGDLVKYKEDCDATGWIGLVQRLHLCHHSHLRFVLVAWTDWAGTERLVDVEVLEVIG